MRFDKFTVKAQEAVVRGQGLAQQADHAEIQPLHLLAALLSETDGVVIPLLQKIGVDEQRIECVARVVFRVRARRKQRSDDSPILIRDRHVSEILLPIRTPSA